MIRLLLAMSVAKLVLCILVLAASCSVVSAASSRVASSKATRRARPIEGPFIISTHFPDIFLGDEHVNNPAQQAALRIRLNKLLDTVEAHYSGALRRVHELHDPKVAMILQDLLLLAGEHPTIGSRHLTAADAAVDRQVDEAANITSAADINVDRRRSQEVTYTAPQRLRTKLSSLHSPRSLEDWSQQIGARLGQLPAGMSFPVLRRLLTAVVVRSWLDGTGKRFTDAEEEAVSGLFVQLYMLHRRGVFNRGIMDHQHVSKSGGTSWCHAAQLNGCTTMRFDKFYVCGVSSFEDKVRWVDGAAHTKLTGGEPSRWALHGVFRSETAPGCASRAAQMRAHRWTYYSNEYTLTGGQQSMSDVEVCSKQFVTSILFRNPLQRIVSHLRFLLLHYKRFMEAQMKGGTGADFFKTYANANATFWSNVAPAVTDNYFARTLLGEATWHAPVGDVSVEKHLSAARLVLMQFDIVVPLEAPPAMTSWLLTFGVGWPVSYTDVHDKNISALQEMFDFDPSPYMPAESELSKLYSRQTVDMELYELAVLIGQLDYLVFSTAAAAGVVPWEGMPVGLDFDEENASYKIACGLLRGPSGAWSGQLVHRKRRVNGGAQEGGVRRRNGGGSGGGDGGGRAAAAMARTRGD
ncbi:hypothetical protein VaNZ11_006214 [Volvox africanus]|uniref:Membrane-associated protein n=1 Tax=Volvox africanus TaxID=51714 RepID=A0ABQ5S1U8_9CHLO|nr:hypothetical protein VaNZ11_006214 [Volvox africanus]